MKNQAKLSRLGMKPGEEIYYYLKFGDIVHGRAEDGIATICLLPHRGAYCRGIAFCNPKDQFIREKGRGIALGRAIKAWEQQHCSGAVSLSTPAGILRMQNFLYLSTYAPGLTDYEQKVILLVARIRNKAARKATAI